MSILKDFKEFKEYRKNKKNMYFSNKLYLAELGHFCVRSEMTEHPLFLMYGQGLGTMLMLLLKNCR